MSIEQAIPSEQSFGWPAHLPSTQKPLLRHGLSGSQGRVVSVNGSETILPVSGSHVSLVHGFSSSQSPALPSVQVPALQTCVQVPSTQSLPSSASVTSQAPAAEQAPASQGPSGSSGEHAAPVSKSTSWHVPSTHFGWRQGVCPLRLAHCSSPLQPGPVSVTVPSLSLPPVVPSVPVLTSWPASETVPSAEMSLSTPERSIVT